MVPCSSLTIIQSKMMETVDVSKESKPEPKSVKRKTSSKRRVKKKVTLFADDNIIFDDPNTASELGKSISQSKAEEAEAARQVHATHARIVIESVLEHTKRRKSGKVTSDLPKKLKGVPSLTLEEQEAAEIVQALKESKKTGKRHLGTGGSSEGNGTKPGVPDESTVVSATSSEGIEDKLDDEENDDKEGDVDDEDDETESDEDDIYKYKIRDKDVTDATKADAEKTSEVMGDAKKTKLSPKSSSLSVSSESPSITTVTTLPAPSVSTTPSIPQQKTTLIPTPTITIDALIITIAVSEFDALSAVQLRVSKLEKDMSDLKKIDLFAEALAALKTQVPSVIDNYLGYKVRDVFQKELTKHTTDLIQKYSLQQIPELPKKQTPTVDLE
ncbi:hypothetical protein Tco_0484658 [Tanacetum coccineum]